MSNSLIMVLNSKFRTADSNSSSDFTISIGQSISIKQMVIQSVTLPNTVYNIDSSNNVGFITLIGLGTYVILVPVGQYNLADFLITLNGHQTRKMNKNFLWSIKISSVNVRSQNQSLVMTKTEKS